MMVVKGGRSPITRPGRATRTDRNLGIREEAEFLGSGNERIFGLRYLPEAAAADVGVVMCESVLAQFIAHYRASTVIARFLATRGLAVQRFHHRGMGNSDGDISRLSLPAMREDAREAETALREATGVEHILYFGISLGGYVAASASPPRSPLVLDSPPRSGRQFLRQAFRAHAMYSMQDGTPETRDSKELMADLRATDDVALLGFRLPLALYESVEATDLAAEVGGDGRRVLLVASGRAGELNPEAKRVKDELEGAGADVEVRLRPREDPFWYVENTAPESQPDTRELASLMVEWAEELFGDPTGQSSGEVGHA